MSNFCPECGSEQLKPLGIMPINPPAWDDDDQWYDHCRWGFVWLCLECDERFAEEDEEIEREYGCDRLPIK